jgi:predicted GNAT family N-acyltransferase
MSKLTVRVLPMGTNLEDALEIRRAVFQIEQGISEADDFDGRDAGADQFVAYLGEAPVATARVRYLADGGGKIERVAVLKAYRGKDYGLDLMDFIVRHIRSKPAPYAVLESQSSVASFYEKLGFHKTGAEFEDVGIPHIKMKLEL